LTLVTLLGGLSLPTENPLCDKQRMAGKKERENESGIERERTRERGGGDKWLVEGREEWG